MSTTLGDAFVRVRPDTDGFAQEAGSGIGGALKKVAVGVAGIFAAAKVKDFLTDSTTGYREHLKVVAVTNQVIKTTGGAANISAKGVSNLSDQIERKTGVDGDAIQSGANLLLTFTNLRNEAGRGNKIYNRSTALLADMSVALGQSAKGSAIQLGKALNDPVKGVTALSKVGVSFTEQQKTQIKTLVDSGKTLSAQKIILKELGKEFGGAAKAAADPADKARVAYHALQDQVGSVTVPVMNKLAGVFANKVAPQLSAMATKYLPPLRRALLDLLDGIDFSKFKKLDFSSFASSSKGVGDGFKKIGDSLKGIDFGKLGDALGKGTADTVSVFGVAIGFAADHVDTLAKYLPLLVAAFIAYKAVQGASNVVAIAHLPILAAQVVANLALASSQRALAAQLALLNGTENVGMLTRIRATVVTVASTVASTAASVATKVWAATQWLLNAAMNANPIGLVVAGIALLIAGAILAYKKVDWFRSAVDAVWGALKTLGGFVKDVFIGYLKMLAKIYLTVGIVAVQAFKFMLKAAFAAFDGILSAAAKGLGWVPGLGKKIKSAKEAFDKFGDGTINKLDQLEGKLRETQSKIDGVARNRSATITLNYNVRGLPGNSTGSTNASVAEGQAGGRVRRPTKKTIIRPSGRSAGGGGGGGPVGVRIHDWERGIGYIVDVVADEAQAEADFNDTVSRMGGR